ncbi:MAG: NAD(P)/FAD-dependent oxidoreductase [Bacteroidota bacterium]
MYDILIIGGGLAGLSAAIRLSEARLKVALVEKNHYPFHRVCGEYISNESIPFLNSLGIDPFQLGAVALDRFRLSSPRGNYLDLSLQSGGFGISRYTLDEALYHRAAELGTDFFLGKKAMKLQSEADWGQVELNDGQLLEARFLLGAYGKRSNLDSYLNRQFFRQRSPYLGVKYHIKTDLHPQDQIALHNFSNGYCGISRVENDTFCLCYLSSRSNLKKYGSIAEMEENILHQNPFLKNLFQNSDFLFDKPKVINEISFAPKPQFESGVFMVGDTSGMITPLCGNGMAMAFHGSKILSGLMIQHFKSEINYHQLIERYQKNWRKQFARRLWVGRNIQRFFGDTRLSEALLESARWLPGMAGFLVRQTHGKAFR